MQICDFKIFHYQLPLSRELAVFGKTLKQREGFIIQLSDEAGNSGFGETSPLPGASLEMPNVVVDQLKALRQRINGQVIAQNIGQKGKNFSSWLENMPLAPSVHFGIETAVLSLKAAHLKKSLTDLLTENPQTTLAVNGLLQGTREAILKEAENLLDLGFTTLKLKVGSASLADDIATCNALTKLINGRAIVRLDANKAWDIKSAFEFCRAIDFAAIEYIEEPLKDFSRVAEFYEETLIPVAIDESLKEHSLREIKSLDGVEVVILKPTILGGFEKITRMTEEAHSYGLRSVISSTFESGIGLRALAHMAACFSKHTAVGLDTGKWLKTDTVSPPLALPKGRLLIEKCQLQNLHLNGQQLQEVK